MHRWNTCFGVFAFEACNIKKKKTSGTCIFLWILHFFLLRNIFFIEHFSECYCKDISKKYFKIICIYITIYYVPCVARSCKGSFMHMGVSEIGKKVARSTNAAKKSWSVYSKHVFSTNRLQFKNHYLFFLVSLAIFYK